MTRKKSDTDPRPKAMFYLDRDTAKRFCEVGIKLDSDHAFLFAYLDRYSANMDKSGAYMVSVASISRSTGFSSDEIEEMLPALEAYGLAYLHDLEVVISSESVLQCAWWAKSNPNNQANVSRTLASLGLTPASHRFLNPLKGIGIDKNRKEGYIPDYDSDYVPSDDQDGLEVVKGVSK